MHPVWTKTDDENGAYQLQLSTDDGETWRDIYLAPVNENSLIKNN